MKSSSIKTKVQVQKNIMELLVDQEIEKQISNYPSNIRQFINIVEVSTYALNRLPPLYASSLEGLEKQKARGNEEFRHQIANAVRQGFAAVQRDLLRNSTPLLGENSEELATAQLALQELINCLPPEHKQNLSWEKIVKMVKPVLIKMIQQPQDKQAIEHIALSLTQGWTDYNF